MPRLIEDLSSKRALDPAIAGGKGASLAWLRRQGFQTPIGFVVTTAAFPDAMAGVGGRGSDSLDERSPSQVMSKPIEEAIRRAYQRLGGSVAVRSSMVSEDGALASYAGQLDTVLSVQGEEAVLQAVLQCWASAFGGRATRYAAERDKGTEQRVEPVVAVIVQRMVAAVSAGVAFSADPDTGQRDVLIEAVHGLGDKLVQGLVRPDRFRVDARGALLEAIAENPQAPALGPDQALALAGLVRDIARQRDAPQDVEWAWDGGRFHLLQTRPITSLAGLHVYSNRMVSDMAPGLVKPLVYSVLTIGNARWVFGRIFTDLIGPNDVDFARLVHRIHSRVYADVTLMGQLLEKVGLPPNFMEMMGRDERGDGRRRSMNMRSIAAVVKLTRFSWRHARLDNEIRAFLAHYASTLAPYESADWAEADAPTLTEALDRLVTAHADLSWCNFMAQINMMGRDRILNRWAKKVAPEVNPGDLVRGLVGLKSLEPNTELRRLAGLAQALEPETRLRLRQTDNDSQRRTLLHATAAGQELLQDVDKFMLTYGHLSANGSDFSEMPWSETPTLIWQAIVRAADQDPTAFMSDEDPSEARKAARATARGRLPFLQRRAFDRLLASETTYIDLREQVSDATSQGIYQMHRILVALADVLVRRGNLAEPGDLFYLTYPEVYDLIAGELTSGEAQARCASRRAEMAEDAKLDLPPIIFGDRVPTTAVRLPADQEYLTGIGGSSGRAQGVARVVLTPAQAPADLGPNDILVVPFTDVGWTPLFPGIGGIVAETGGRLSHTSIVAREYGLPAVVSVHQATHMLHNGQPITIDGDTGRVYFGLTPAA